MIFKSRPAFAPLLFAIFCACWSQTLFATATADGSILERKAYSFPSYEQALKETGVKDYASKDAYQQAVGDPAFELQKLKYMSDGLKVVAYLYKPVRTEGKIFPAIIF